MFAEFIETVAETAVPPHVTNPYLGTGPAAIRRHNLHRYLQQMNPRRPTIMLVAEAPGYRGCRLSGIPFASRQILTQGVAQVGLFGVARGYKDPQEWPHIRREASATIMWQTLPHLPTLPLLWNAFPWHPHRPGLPQSNRPPKTSELALGEPFVRQLQHLFPITTLVAVGRKAAQALARWQIPCHPVRHPSHGGKAAFQKGLREICG